MKETSVHGSYSERDSCLQTVIFVDSTEIQYTEMKFILNTFPRRCDGWSFFEVMRNSYFDSRTPFENDNPFIST